MSRVGTLLALNVRGLRFALELFGVAAALLVVPFAMWWQLPILAWWYVRVMARTLPEWLAWVVAVVISAHLAAVLGWSWGVAFLLTASTVMIGHWQGQTQRIYLRLLAEGAVLAAWLVVLAVSTDIVRWGTTSLVLILGILMIWRWEEQS